VSGAAEGKIMVDDLITEINGKAVTSTRTYNDALRDLKEGDAVKVKITRGDKSSDIDLVMGSTSRASFEIAPLAGASPEAARLREIFMYRGKKGWQPK
jgi:C-terminal processing protease CtpA/Prc